MEMLSASDLRPGVVVAGTYEITRLLGRGGMGSVWEARHLRLQSKMVAIKVLLQSMSEQPDVFARFKREAEICSRLGHPNIVQVLDFNTLDNGAPYIVLEYLRGETLGERLKRGPLALAHALDVARQVGSALHAAHVAGVVHRDMKPDNIFLVSGDSVGMTHEQVKVLDFGISKIQGSNTLQTSDSILMGTPRYMSPEQVKGHNSTVDRRTDVFALGTIVYEMLAGRPAFWAEEVTQILFKIAYEEPPALEAQVSNLPDTVIAAIKLALAKPLDQRLPDVPSFIEALNGRLPQMPSPRPASPPPTRRTLSGEMTIPGRALDKPKTFWLPWALAGIVFSAASASGAYFFFSNRAGQPQPGPATLNSEKVESQSAKAPVKTPEVTTDSTAPSPTTAGKTEPSAVAADKSPSRPPRPAAAEKPTASMSTAVRAALDEAEQALQAGNASTALHLARRSLAEEKTSTAYAIIARAYCRSGDLGNAKAQLPHLSTSDRARVVRECKRFDVELD